MKNKLLVFLLLILSVRVYGQCTLNATLTTPNPVVCSGSPINLTATPAAGTSPYNYAWSTGETSQVISVNKTGTYTVTITDAQNCTVVKNISITTGTTPTAPVVDDAIACPGSSATLTAKGPAGVYQWYDENGVYKFTGASYNTPAITDKTIFFVETTIGGCTSARTMVTVYPIAPPNVAGGSACPGSSVTLNASGAGNYEWFDGGTRVGTGPTFTTPALFTSKTYHVVGTTAGCVSTRVPVVAEILPLPAAPTIQGPTSTCGGTSVTLSATAPANAIFEWYTQQTGGTPVISSPVYTTPILSSTVRYYVQAIVGDCISPRTEVIVTVNQVPGAPTVTAPPPACAGSQATLAITSPVAGAIYRWYASNTGGTLLDNTPTFRPVVTVSTQFYVEVEINGCTSTPRRLVSVTVNPAPVAPIVNTVPTICEGQTATITATGPGGAYSWFEDANGGTPLLTNSPTFTTSALTATKTFYVETTANGCTSRRTAIIITVVSKPQPPTVTGNTPVCANSGIVLTAAGTGTSFEWFDAANGGNLLASGATFTSPALLANTSFFVQISANGCSSTRTQIDVVVNPSPTAPTIAPVAPVCAGNTVTLNASGAATLRWFGSAAGGPVLGTGSSFITPALNNNISYWVDSFNGSCASARARINISVISTGQQFNYASATYCKSSPNPTPTVTSTGGTFSVSVGTGLVIDPFTGEIDILNSSIGSFEITYTNGCVISTDKLNLVVTTDATFTYGSANYCQSAANPAPAFTLTSTPGVFTATPAGLVFRNRNTGVINVGASLPNTYTITNTINSTTGCPPATYTQIVTIDERVIVNAGPDQTVAQGENAQLNGTVTGAATTGTWTTSGAGIFLPNNSTLNAIYQPATGENGPITLTLTSANPGTACGPIANAVVITFNPKPNNPTFSGGTPVCAGSSTTLTATGPVADSYKWYTVPTNGAAVFTGISFTTPPLTTAGVTTYYLEAILNGVPSNRTTINITVTAIPDPPVTNAVVNTCYGSDATLTATSPVPGGIISWYTAVSGSSPIFTGATFNTGALIANTTYYVQVTNGTCESNRAKVEVILKPIPQITSIDNAETCNGIINYNITANLAGTTFNWSRLPRPEISNPNLTNQTSQTITETLVNTSGATVNVIYRITPTLNGCDGASFDYVVKVFPTARVTSLPPAPICSKQISPGGFYTILFNTPVTDVSWTRAAKAGIKNPAVPPQHSPTLYENLENTTTAAIDVDYIFTFNTPDCPNPTNYTLTVTVNPKVTINSANYGGEICSGSDINYEIKSDVPTANFIWTRRDDPRITPTPNPTTANRITEVLTNTSGNYVDVFYDIAATTGCQTPFTYKVTVKPQPAQPEAFTNAPICVGSTLYLIPGVTATGSTYHWTGPNGYTSDSQYPNISNVTAANSGVYILYVTKNGCTSIGGQTLFAQINEKHGANAGGTQDVCINAPIVQLNGIVTGGSGTGMSLKARPTCSPATIRDTSGIRLSGR
ncbi:MAG: PKD-like domain-containing protein [Bacteroidota bacterium]